MNESPRRWYASITRMGTGEPPQVRLRRELTSVGMVVVAQPAWDLRSDQWPNGSINVITPIDIFLSESHADQAVAYFQYDWTVRDGSLITFKVMDLFSFTPDGDLVTYLDIIYDTHPIRVSHGNKYDPPT